MRLVSYDGLFDVLYDNVMLFVEERGEAYAIRAYITENTPAPIMGVYETRKRTFQVLGVLRGKYGLMDVSVFYFPQE